ncbi:hypothetical protein Cgig2_018708 [Carnegiea gigantea]|uniref:Uncharacterized protein n=1 Tax=Carnegiea gigantea TaxID=171969 RepID=A0A9Q1KGJ0_9CARY|nr:hypothetical protein Cgig2_018708 [Carnegiea gigantea]
MQQLVWPNSLNGGSGMFTLSVNQNIFLRAIPPALTYCLHYYITACTYTHFPNWSKIAPDSPIYDKIWSFFAPPSLIETSQVNPSTTGLKRPCQPPSVVGTSQVNPSTRSVPLHNQSQLATVKVARDATQQEVHQKIGSTSQASRESPLNANNDNKDLARSSQNDQGNEEAIKGSILP